MKLIVGLGNPGKQYEKTRHNVGFRVIDALPQQPHVIYLKPDTFMNNSGTAVKAAMRYYKISLPDVLVVFDDKDLPLGTIRFRTKGSSGGHNGVQSIIDHLGSSPFARLKIGTAPADPNEVIHDTTDYVLGKFTKEEEKQLPDIIEQAAQKVKEWIRKTPTHPNV